MEKTCKPPLTSGSAQKALVICSRLKWYSVVLLTAILAIASSLVACAPAPISAPAIESPPTTETPAESPPQGEAPTSEQQLPSGLVHAEVTRVIDGDTIEVNIEGHLYKVRYIGIDTPETVHPAKPVEYFGKEASEKNRELVEGKTVRLEKDVSETDKYGRLLRYVWVDDVMANAELVRLGYAQVSTYPPDVKYQALFLQLQREAEEAGLGLWAEPVPEPPRPSDSNVQITKIFYDGVVPRVESDEYVEIKNLGSESQDLTGWVLKDIDEGYPSFTFPSYVLAPGGSIQVYTNEIHPESGGFSFGYGKAAWNNKDPDTAALYNAQGQEVSRKSY